MKRCGECSNCKEMEKIQKRVLACANPPFSHADPGVVELWNRELDLHPCLNLTLRNFRVTGSFELTFYKNVDVIVEAESEEEALAAAHKNAEAFILAEPDEYTSRAYWADGGPVVEKQ